MPNDALKALQELDLFRQRKGREAVRSSLDSLTQPSDDNVWKARLKGFVGGAGRTAYDFLTGSDEDVVDPLSFGMSPAATIGQKTLPAVAKEAYSAVKGLKGLYSRLTDSIVQKMPDRAYPSKIESIAKSGTAAEEISLRKLDEFLKARNPQQPVAKEEVLAHLDANPIELQVKKFGYGPPRKSKTSGQTPDDNRYWDEIAADENVNPAQDLLDFEDDMRQRYGMSWRDRMTMDELDHWSAIDRAVRDPGRMEPPKYAEYQVQAPGTEGYTETLIKAPEGSAAPPQFKNLQARQRDVERRRSELFANPDIPAAEFDVLMDPIREELRQIEREMEGGFAAHMQDYVTPHWPGDRNVLVHSRSENRPITTRPNPEYDALRNEITDLQNKADSELQIGEMFLEDTPEDFTLSPEYYEYSNKFKDLENKLFKTSPTVNYDMGRLIEEVQSDLHQAGKIAGYDPETNAENIKRMTQELDDLYHQLNKLEANNGLWLDVTEGSVASPEYTNLNRKIARALDNRSVAEAGPMPNLPFKGDASYELALKEQLLDAAADPDVNWVGLSGADIQKARFPSKKNEAGMDFMYDKSYPAAIQRLLKPFGVNLEKRSLPPEMGSTTMNQLDFGPEGEVFHWSPTNFKTQIASVWPRRTMQRVIPHEVALDRFNHNRELAEQIRAQERSVPGPEVWFARLPPEVKAAILERGFPVFAALMGLRSTLSPQQEQ